MVAYAFERRHFDNLKSGAKTFTLRQTGRKRHARIGELVQIRDGRTGPVVMTAECSYRARILFAERGVVRVLTPTFTFLGAGLFNLFNACEQGAPQQAEHLAKLAVADGFASWPELVAWHATQSPPDAAGLFAREAIGLSGVVVRG